MKKLKPTDTLFTYDVREKLGKYGWYYDISLVDEHGNGYRTYIDESNRNLALWWSIVNHPERGYAISGAKVKRTRNQSSEFPIINADSPIELLHETDITEMREFIVQDILTDQDSLFEY